MAVPTILHAVIILVLSKDVTLQMISDELSEWGLNGWDWQLR